jgi:Holliday junction resolvase RusA-like endonuclease
MFTPEKTVSYENLVGWTAAQAMAGKPLIEQPVAVWLTVYCAVPASWSKVQQHLALTGNRLPTTKPDIDNLIKAIFDAMNGVVWKDDVQVVDLAVGKRYDATPGVAVAVKPL